MTLSTDTAPGFAAAVFPSFSSPATEQREEEAKVRGYSAGYASGLRAAQAEIADLRATLVAQADEDRQRARENTEYTLGLLNRAAAAMHARAVPVLDGLEAALGETALELAEAVLATELSDADTSARTAVARALNPALPAPVHTVRLNPSDLARLDAPTREAAGVAFQADPSLAPGDAIAEYEHGFLDARLSTAFDRIRAALSGAAQ